MTKTPVYPAAIMSPPKPSPYVDRADDMTDPVIPGMSRDAMPDESVDPKKANAKKTARGPMTPGIPYPKPKGVKGA